MVSLKEMQTIKNQENLGTGSEMEIGKGKQKAFFQQYRRKPQTPTCLEKCIISMSQINADYLRNMGRIFWTKCSEWVQCVRTERVQEKTP